MKRPVLMAAIGYIIGIIEGLYLHISIVPLYLCIAAIYSLIHILVHSKKSNLWKITRYVRYIKLYINNYAIIILLISSIISNITVHKLEKTYTELQQQLSESEETTLIGMIASPVTQKEYEQVYTLKIDYAIHQGEKTKVKDLSVYIHNKETSNNTYQYGDIVEVKGSFEIPEGQRNYGGFDYSMYLKTEKILGNVKVSQIELIRKFTSAAYNNLTAHSTSIAQNIKATDLENAHKNILTILQAKATEISQIIQQRICQILPTEISSILIGLLLGNTQYIEEDVIQNFRNANISHVLAVSGMHMSYLILIAMAVFNKPLGKRKAYISSIILILAYMFITGFSPSIVRAGIMGILLIISKLIHKCNDVFTNISIAVLGILLNNPYTILSLGFQLSFGGTIGIVLFNRFVSKILKKWIKGKLLEMISVTISAQMVILPISIFHFNTISPYFLVTNLLIGIIIGPIMACSFGFLFLILISTKLATTLSWMIEIPIHVLIWISKFGKLPFSCIHIATPHLWHILLYFTLIILFIFLYRVYKAKYVTNTIIRFRNVIALIKFYIKHRMSKNNKRRLIYLMILGIAFFSISKIIPNNLDIHFVDVGQGDCTFIETPSRKNNTNRWRRLRKL